METIWFQDHCDSSKIYISNYQVKIFKFIQHAKSLIFQITKGQYCALSLLFVQRLFLTCQSLILYEKIRQNIQILTMQLHPLKQIFEEIIQTNPVVILLEPDVIIIIVWNIYFLLIVIFYVSLGLSFVEIVEMNWDITPFNLTERLFCIIMALILTPTFAYFVNSIVQIFQQMSKQSTQLKTNMNSLNT
ncbi:unnamed protein product (macronuclear) [Paramecium tetraurelia]|uniref:Transmembrane protein n=1 Tax=Paramecium tetraurelia TaxID=5888 RepID=A0D2X0_PARTE|nr:uncharacterized protein GSPATT00039215001 [Paramecium tetraurelia]CAK77387.1 unnamed protein product [Paramecium tetraurelia]|eukprot:XP_001444784.1 hypothetical protein (macronuclear) [Paramecium tetraurelia strain d4-2]